MARLCQTRVAPTTKSCRSVKQVKKCKTTTRRCANAKCARGARDKHSPHRRRPKATLNETSNLLDVHREAGPSKERWIALSLFCALACSQSCVWNSWGPIAGFTLLAFPTWHKNMMALLSNWGCITYLACCFPCCWLLCRKGLPMSIRIAAILSTVATFVRCLSSQEVIFTVTAHTAAILNGISGVIVGPATALVSAVWFPQGERTTATGISAAFNQLGVAVSYLIGPAIIETSSFPRSIGAESNEIHPTKRPLSMRSDHVLHLMTHVGLAPDEQPILTSSNLTVDQATLRVQIMSFVRIEFVAQLLVLIGVLGFFPSQSPRQSAEGTSFGQTDIGVTDSIVRLLRNKNMWRLCLAAAMSQGVTGPWLAMITMIFGSMISQDDADKLAFRTVICSCVLSLMASRVVDIFQGHMKIAIYTLLAVSSAMFLWVLLLDSGVLAFDKNELHAAVILGISACWSTPALFLELASEIAFPISEAIVGGYMILLANIVGMVFYFSYFLPGMVEYWSTYCVFGNLTIATIFVMYVKDEYNRTNMK